MWDKQGDIPLCALVGLPKVPQSLECASRPSPCLRMWVSVCSWTWEDHCCLCCGPRACQSAGSFSPLSPKGSLAWFCVLILVSVTETFPRVYQAALALSGLSPVFNYLFTVRVSLHVRPHLCNLPWYNPICNAHLEWLSVLPPGWSSATSACRSALLAGSCRSDLLGMMVSTELAEQQSHLRETPHIMVAFRWDQTKGLVVSSIALIAGSPQLCYGKAVCYVSSTYSWHMATSFTSCYQLLWQH